MLAAAFCATCACRVSHSRRMRLSAMAWTDRLGPAGCTIRAVVPTPPLLDPLLPAGSGFRFLFPVCAVRRARSTVGTAKRRSGRTSGRGVCSSQRLSPARSTIRLVPAGTTPRSVSTIARRGQMSRWRRGVNYRPHADVLHGEACGLRGPVANHVFIETKTLLSRLRLPRCSKRYPSKELHGHHIGDG